MMLFFCILQNIEDFHPRKRYFQADFSQFGVFGCHVYHSLFGVLRGFRYDGAALDSLRAQYV
jgi:hypothetical protein